MALFPIRDLLLIYLEREVPKVGVLDVGAMSLGSDETDVYYPLFKQNLCTVVGFEPVKEECDKLIAQQGDGSVKKFFPYFIGKGGCSTFYLCNAAMTSSLYEPNTELVEKFSCLPEVMRVVETSQVTTKRLDDILQELGDIDFIKLDVQGGELDVIQGGKQAFAAACVVQTEVEFIPLYKDQPLFADVDSALRDLGFTFHRFGGLAGRSMKPLQINSNPYQPISQHLWSDAIYVRDMIELKTLSVNQLIKTAVVLHEVYQSYDVVHHVLRQLEKSDNISPRELSGCPGLQSLSEAYFHRLTGQQRPESTA
eukprot:gene27569-34011_t